MAQLPFRTPPKGMLMMPPKGMSYVIGTSRPSLPLGRVANCPDGLADHLITADPREFSGALADLVKRR